MKREKEPRGDARETWCARVAPTAERRALRKSQPKKWRVDRSRRHDICLSFKAADCRIDLGRGHRSGPD